MYISKYEMVLKRSLLVNGDYKGYFCISRLIHEMSSVALVTG